LDKEKEITPLRYAERMLIVLAKESPDKLAWMAEPDAGFDEWDLAAKAGIISQESVNDRRKQFYSGGLDDLPYIASLMIEEEWVESLRPDRVSFRTLCPTAKGLRHAEWLARPRYQKAWDYLKGDIRASVFAVITALVTVGVLHLVGC
jgi:hypothetical protein